MDLSVDEVIDAIGMAAMMLASAAMVPQIILAHQRQSTQDLSACWQGMYTCGIFAQLLYFWHYSLWILFYPCLVQLFFMSYLIVLSLRFDVLLKGKIVSTASGAGVTGELP